MPFIELSSTFTFQSLPQLFGTVTVKNLFSVVVLELFDDVFCNLND
ncbi:hypothetical protein [Intestinibacter bartlettii]|nr:hypothetical protein [Intestinibacter bartlettii]MCC2706512.1 hypothetical protein [Intestinibacter bartlettii]MDU6198930.1 hypothetical protein [Intestinibacter bartlettii]